MFKFSEMDVDMSENRLSELYPSVNQRSTPIPTRWADNEEDCGKFF